MKQVSSVAFDDIDEISVDKRDEFWCIGVHTKKYIDFKSTKSIRIVEETAFLNYYEPTSEPEFSYTIHLLKPSKKKLLRFFRLDGQKTSSS